MVYLSDQDKNRIQKERHHQERIAAQAEREKDKHQYNLERMREAQDYAAKKAAAEALLEKELVIASKLLDHGLKPDELDLEYHQTIKLADITLQSLQAELNIRDEIAHREHKREVDKIYQTMMMEITKESARILDEQNKAIAIDQQQTISALTKAKQLHDQTLEKDYLDHQHQLERDNLLSRLKREEFTHEEMIRLIVALIAKQLGLNAGDISEEKVKEWVTDFGQGL